VLGELASVVVAAGSGIACLGDGGDVDGRVELMVASSGQAVGFLLTTGDVDGCGAGVAGVVLLVGKRRMSPVRARILAAVRKPMPWIWVRVVPPRGDRCAEFLLQRFDGAS
jgi:hypothetical protein